MTTAYIKNIVDYNGNIIHPQTITSAVYDDNNKNLLSNVMAYKPTITTTTLLASNWNSNTKIYSFEADYPSAMYNIEVDIDGDNCTDEQLDAWIAAKPLKGIKNKLTAKGNVPSIDIPVIITSTLIYNGVLPYLSFIGNEDFTLRTVNGVKNWDGTLEYSTNLSTWNTWNGRAISSADNTLYLRGTGNTKITGALSTEYSFLFIGTDALKIACKGNIENLLDYETVSAGGHPTMADYCYSSMFQDCTALTTPPELPATTLASYCYARMFFNCTSLTTVPELPATTLAASCYFRMFCNCTSLTTVPALPATALANVCYAQMFAGCTSIKLSTTQTGEYQTAYRIPTSGTGTTADNALTGMFASTGGTFTETPEINTTYYTSNTVV